MSSLLAFENSEVLQDDPARAGIFNPENNLPAFDPVVEQIANTVLTDRIMFSTLPGHLLPRQGLMLSLMFAQDGKIFKADQITDSLPGNSDVNNIQFGSLLRYIKQTPHADALEVRRRRTGSEFRWAQEWYPLEHQPQVTSLVTQKIGQLSVGTRRHQKNIHDKIATAPEYRVHVPPTTPLPAATVENSWEDSALCAQTDPDNFFPEKGVSGKIAKKICSMCTVRLDCLYDAIENGMEHDGIRAGFTYSKIEKLRKSVDLS
jgi:WhiB family redox-sensing transcriptional regulator